MSGLLFVFAIFTLIVENRQRNSGSPHWNLTTGQISELAECVPFANPEVSGRSEPVSRTESTNEGKGSFSASPRTASSDRGIETRFFGRDADSEVPVSRGFPKSLIFHSDEIRTVAFNGGPDQAPGTDNSYPSDPHELSPPIHLPPHPLPVNDGLTSALSPAISSSGFVLRFQDAPWDLILRRFAREAGLSLQMDATPPGTFSYSDEVPKTATEALDIINDQLLQQGFVLVRRERAAAVLDARKKIPDAYVPQVISSDLPRLGRTELASLLLNVNPGKAEALSKEVQSLLTPIGSVLALAHSDRLLITDFGNNLRRIHELLIVSSSGRRPSYVYRLRNTSAVEVAAAVSQLLTGRTSDFGSLKQSPEVQTASFQSSSGIGDLPAVQVIPEATTNTILISGSPQDIEEACQLIAEIDICPPQVLIQALLVEVELGNVDEFGIELGVQDSVLFDRSVINNLVTLSQTNTSPNGVQTTTQQVVSQTSEPGFNFNNKPLGNNTSVHPSKVGTQGLTNLAVGRINGDLGFGGLVLSAGSESINVLIRALAAKYKVDVLSRPQITTLDNQPAHIQIGQQVPVIDGVTITPVGSASPIIRQDQAGIILKVTPRVGPDGIVIDVVAEKSQFQTAPGTGVPIYTDVTNGNVIEAPIKDLTTAQTMVGVKDGQCMVLGGMITKSLQVAERKVPFLGDIPLLGRAFRYDLEQHKRKELLIFLTPHVITDPQRAEQLKASEVARVDFPYADAEQVGGPLFMPSAPLEPLPPGLVPLSPDALRDIPPPEPAKERWWPQSRKSKKAASPTTQVVELPPPTTATQSPSRPPQVIVPVNGVMNGSDAPRRLTPGVSKQPVIPSSPPNPYSPTYRSRAR